MEKVCPWCGQPSDQGRLKNKTEAAIGCLLFQLGVAPSGERLRRQGGHHGCNLQVVLLDYR